MSDVISAQELRDLINQQQAIHLLDVRTPEEYQAYNIGGQLIPINELSLRISEVPRDKPIIVICRSGHRSGIAQTLLLTQGFENVKNLAGGLIGYAQVGNCN